MQHTSLKLALWLSAAHTEEQGQRHIRRTLKAASAEIGKPIAICLTEGETVTLKGWSYAEIAKFLRTYWADGMEDEVSGLVTENHVVVYPVAVR